MCSVLGDFDFRKELLGKLKDVREDWTRDDQARPRVWVLS